MTGYDYSPTALRRARARGGDITYTLWDINVDQAPRALVPGSVDLVACRDALAYLNVARLAVELRRLLKPGTGRLYAMTPVDSCAGTDGPFARSMSPADLDRLCAHWHDDQRRFRIDDRHVGVLLRAPAA